jgi:hypothetical protein
MSQERGEELNDIFRQLHEFYCQDRSTHYTHDTKERFHAWRFWCEA